MARVNRVELFWNGRMGNNAGGVTHCSEKPLIAALDDAPRLDIVSFAKSNSAVAWHLRHPRSKGHPHGRRRKRKCYSYGQLPLTHREITEKAEILELKLARAHIITIL